MKVAQEGAFNYSDLNSQISRLRSSRTREGFEFGVRKSFQSKGLQGRLGLRIRGSGLCGFSHLALGMSAPGPDLGLAKRRGDVGLKGLCERPLMLMMLAVRRWKCQHQVLIWGQPRPEGLERGPADAHDAGCPALEMSAPGADLGSAKRRGDVGLKG